MSVVGPGGAFVTGEGKVLPFARGKAWTFRAVDSRPARLRRHLAVKTFPASELARACEFLATWKERAPEAGLWITGQVLSVQGRPFHDNRSVHVVVDHGDDEASAEAKMKALAAEGQRPWIIEETLEPAGGTIVLLDEKGKELHRFRRLATVVSSSPVRVNRVEHGKGYSWHGFQDRSFRGRVEITLDKTGKLAVVNRLPLEEYLLGVVPSEISATAPVEAIRAQAVAARGETLAKLGLRHEADPYDLCATQHCQVYGGKTREHPVTSDAVTQTQGLVLIHDGRIQDAVYSACCGGHTENNENVWSSPPSSSLRGVPCYDAERVPFSSPISEGRVEAWVDAVPDCWCKTERTVEKERFRWTKRFSADALDAVVAKTLPEVGAVRALEVLGRGVSGRLLALRIVGEGATVTVPKELAIRKLFGGLRSACFVVRREDDGAGKRPAWVFRGAGWGHGVGLCQVGAQGMARQGASFARILSHYYRGTDLRNLRGESSKGRSLR